MLYVLCLEMGWSANKAVVSNLFVRIISYGTILFVSIHPLTKLYVRRIL